MSEFDQIKIRRLDLTVLLIFLGLVRTRKATAVAQELRVTSSSISHSLRRLRDVFDDELFLRRPHGLEPTSFALRIEPDIRRAVDAVQAALAGPAPFEPTTAEATLRIAAGDREVASLIPRAFAKLSGEAPGLRMSVQSLSRADTLRGLSEGSLDFAIGYFSNLGEDLDRDVIRTETYLVTARRGHRIWRRRLTAKAYAAETHVLVSSDGTMTGIVDKTLAERGMTRVVALAVPSFLPTLSILAASDLVATLPASLVREHAGTFALDFEAPPIDVRPFEVSLISHRRNRRSPVHQWCRSKLLES